MYFFILVATAPTVYGIETQTILRHRMLLYRVATAPTVYGIETQRQHNCIFHLYLVAIALTVYGIETFVILNITQHQYFKLQQHLPFTVLKLEFAVVVSYIFKLQQHLSFTVCAAECEVAEEQSYDETHTLQVPERSEGKTKVMWK